MTLHANYRDNKQYCSYFFFKEIEAATSDVKQSSIPLKGRELQLWKVFETQTQDKPYELTTY